MTMIDLPYVQSRKNGFRYRRRIAKELQEALGKTEIIKPLGKTPADVVKRWLKVHAEAERELADAAKGPVRMAPDEVITERDRYRWAGEHISDLGLNPEWSGWAGEDDHEGIAREAIADQIAGKYATDEDNNPIGVGAKDAALLRALALGARQKEPDATLEDARKFYLKEKVDGTPDETSKRQRIDRVVGHIRTALGKDPVLAKLTKADARDVRDHMLREIGNKPATVNRYLNDVRAIINHAIDEMPLADVMNPFNKVAAKLEGVRKNDRKPFTLTQLKDTRERIIGHAGPDLQRIWRILEGTGCRLAEVTGLLVSDLALHHANPHLDLVFHPHRRLKTEGSVRKVPLVGDALKAAQEAVLGRKPEEQSGELPLLFPGYGIGRGSDKASAILMKHVRKVVTDKKVAVHSLRHTMEDRLTLAGIEKATRDLILGHSSGAMSERYGGDDARLEVATGAMKKALN